MSSKIIGYARTSTESQRMDLQVDALRRAGATEIYSEHASGALSSQDRHELAMLLECLQPGDTLVVYALSRLGRSVVDVLTTIQTLTARGVLVKSTTESLDTGTPMGRMCVAMLSAFAEMEREIIVERVNAGIQAAKARGVKLGRKKADTALAEELLAQGRTIAEVVAATGLSASTLKRARRAATAKG
jgi:DNA invertase Pin-like site-specific DNA recombinase